MLYVYAAVWTELLAMAQHQEVVLERQPHLCDRRIAQQFHQARRHADLIQAEEETHLAVADLKQSHLVCHSLFERRARFGVDAQQGRLAQSLDRAYRFRLRLNHDNLAAEDEAWQRSDECFVGTDE